MKIQKPKGRVPTVARKHDPTGVVVHFRKPGHAELTRIVMNHEGRVGDVIAELIQPGACVHKWEGIEDENGVAVGYSIDALNAACEVESKFGTWFNEQLLDVAGISRRGVIVDDSEKKSEPPADGSTAANAPTPPRSAS